jgi:hypothetical protein
LAVNGGPIDVANRVCYISPTDDVCQSAQSNTFIVVANGGPGIAIEAELILQNLSNGYSIVHATSPDSMLWLETLADGLRLYAGFNFAGTSFKNSGFVDVGNVALHSWHRVVVAFNPVTRSASLQVDARPAAALNLAAGTTQSMLAPVNMYLGSEGLLPRKIGSQFVVDDLVVRVVP